ncbi:hypothetical protein BG261_08895 [Floricoccus tropicus]|uniref:Solute-binding protein family 5 domain-containing protein n=1 Tax=Floricoccus tropicus TaxID=1859473 RepID=A0A1E8GRW6_9LACT|nr:ABC transporter substrate-binding protein [Floricoccus tropicus]OFI50228.1 hypothetical protein BG261_08895 [Floricoccus tropicus]
MSTLTKRILGTAAVVSLGLSLAACSGSSSSTEKKDMKAGDFELSYQNPDKAIKGGTLNYGFITETPFIGQWIRSLSTAAIDYEMQAPARSALFATDNSFSIVNGKDKGGMADIEFDNGKKTALITLHDGVKWSDGKDVTARDLYFPYEIIANDKAGSSRWTESLANIVGLEDYHNNKTDKISGLTFPDGEDGKKLLIQFKEVKPGFTQSGNGYYLEQYVPYHYLKDIPFDKLQSDEKTTTKPLVVGPFKPKNIVPGESISYEVNEYYYGEKPKLDSVIVKTVNPSKVVASLKNAEFDIVRGTTPDLYPEVEKLKDKGYAITGQDELAVSVMYYNVGHYDAQKSLNISDRETPVQDVKVRKALSYALDEDSVAKEIYHNLKYRANGTIPPVFSDYVNKDNKGFPYEPEKAEKLLEEAGYTYKKDAKGKDGKTNEVNEKGYLVDKNGKTLSLVFLARSGQSYSEVVAMDYINHWKAVGVDVSLFKNKLTDFNTWADLVKSSGKTEDNQAWDISTGGWSLSSEPSQQDLFSAKAPFNLGHFTSPELTALLDDIDSEKSLDKGYRAKAFQKYQAYIQDTAFVTPLDFSIDWTPVNKRVVGWTQAYDATDLWAKLGVSKDKPEQGK